MWLWWRFCNWRALQLPCASVVLAVGAVAGLCVDGEDEGRGLSTIVGLTRLHLCSFHTATGEVAYISLSLTNSKPSSASQICAKSLVVRVCENHWQPAVITTHNMQQL